MKRIQRQFATVLSLVIVAIPLIAFMPWSRTEEPEEIPIELADAIIRILDYCGYAGIDIDAAISQKHEYNKSRPYRHGGKKC